MNERNDWDTVKSDVMAPIYALSSAGGNLAGDIHWN